ncbi:MAG: ABC transporter substrate-binding protein [Pseudomonadota bacterium]
MLGSADPLLLYTLDAPPLTYLKKSPGHGSVGDVVLAAIERAGDSVQLHDEPWARAQKRVSEGHQLLIMPLSRTPQRENQYTWIAPIQRMDRAFFTLAQRVESFADAKARLHNIGVGHGSAQHEILLAQGFSPDQINPLKIGDSPAHLLMLGRIDAWFNGVPESLSIWRKHSPQPLQMSPVLDSLDLYLACSKHCDRALVERLRLAVEELQRDGTAQRLQDAYQDAPEVAQ